MSEFREKAIAGVSWSVVSQIGRQVLAFVVGVILARLLAPRQFGLVAMITVITGFASVFAELGFGAALIHKQDVEQKHLSSVFWINVGSGALLTGLFMLGAPFIGAFYGEPLLVPLTVFIATTFFFDSLGIVQRTLLNKSIDFKTLSIIEITSAGAGGTIAIGMALTGWGVWSLVAQTVVSSVVASALLWTFNAWRPALTFRWNAVKDLMGFSVNLLATNSLNYWVRNVDNLLIGKVIGSGGLGLYSRAYAVMLFPLQNVSRVIARVMFPSLATIQQDRARVRRVFLRMTRTIALFTFPLMLGLLATTESFVIAVFGRQWAGMIPILRIFCFIGLIQSIVTLIGSLYLSQGRADLQFRVGLFVKPVLITGIVVGLRWGVVGVAAGYATAVLIAQYVNLRFAGGLVNLRYYDIVSNVTGALLCATIMSALVYSLGLFLPSGWPHWAYLAVQVPFGIVAYFVLIHFGRLDAYHDVSALILERGRQLVS